MNTHDIDIELPPLRIPGLEDELTAVLCAAISWGGSVISSEEYVAAKQRFRAAVDAAIEADRKLRGEDQQPFGYFRPEPFGWTDCAATDEGAIALYERPQAQGEPVAWLYEDELPDNYPYEAMFPYSKVDGVRMFPVYAPQPAEPVKE